MQKTAMNCAHELSRPRRSMAALNLIPLDLLPGGVRHVVSWLPFGYLAFEPARLLVTGSLSTGLNPALLLPAWIAGLWLVASGLQRLAIRKFDAVGI